MKYTPKTKPFPHQSKATIRAVKHRNYGIFFEPRCGKSKVALDVAGIHALRGDVKRVLILAPRIALDVWEQQLRKHYPYSYHAETFDEEWSSAPTRFITRSNPYCHFFLAGREETFRRVRQGTRYLRPKQKILEAWKPDLVVVDESHEYKRPGGVGAQDAWRLIRRLRTAASDSTSVDDPPKPWVLLLSGTPNPKGWLDLFAQFRIMDDVIFGTDVASFKEKHVVYGTGRRKWTIIKYRKEETIQKKVRAHSMSISAEEAGLANQQFYQTIRVQLPEKAKRLYLELAEEFVAEFEGGVISAANAGVKRLRLLQICGGYTTDGQLLHGAKVASLKAYLSLLLEQEQSVVVYARFTPEVEACTSVAAGLGYRTFRVDGTVSRADRRLALDALGTSPPKKATALVFQHQAGSRAIELTGAAETVYYSCPDGWVDYFQTSKRTQGPNQHRPVRYTHLICPGTVDVSVLRGLKKKEDQHALFMRNPRRYLLGL